MNCCKEKRSRTHRCSGNRIDSVKNGIFDIPVLPVHHLFSGDEFPVNAAEALVDSGVILIASHSNDADPIVTVIQQIICRIFAPPDRIAADIRQHIRQ